MTSVQQQAELLKAECERLAREVETIMLGVGLTDGERLEASEKARVYEQYREVRSNILATYG